MAINLQKWLVIGIVVLAVVVECIPATTEAAIVRRPPNNLNLKAYWSLNEGVGTIATDFSRNYATGTLTNMEAVDWVSGKMSKALNFDGVNEYVALSSGLSSISGNATFTICTWVNTASLSAAQSIFATGNASVALNAAGLFLNTNGALSMEFAGANSVSTAGGVISINQWYHVCGVKTAGAINTTSTLYVNGRSVALAGGASTGTPNIATTSGTIGRFATASYYFNGKIDEVRVYNTALTASEVMTLYRSGVTTFSSVQKNPVTSGLIGLWSFDGRDVVNGGFLDTSSAGTHPAYMSTTMATSTAYVPGRIGQAMKFDGTDDYMEVPNSADFDFGSSNFTIAWWEYRTGNDNGSVSINRRTAAGDYTPFMVGYSYGGSDLLIYMSSALGGWDVANGEVLGSVTLNQWVHYVVKRSGTTFTAYKDGVQTNTWESALALADAGGTDPEYDLAFGSYQNVYFFRGTLDDIRIYNRAITNTEIAQLYTVGAAAVSKMNVSKNTFLTDGLVGLWSFDGADMEAGSTAYDRSGSGFDGTLSGMTAASAVPGKVGQGLYFDGVNDEISVSNLDAYNPLSIATWLKRGQTNSGWYEGILGCSGGGGWTLGIDGYTVNGRLYISAVGISAAYSTGTILDEEWHHVVLTYDGTNARFYIDGVLDSTSSYPSVTFDCLGAPYNIGNTNVTSLLKGRLDDLRLYNRVLTAAEVSALYNRTK